MPLTRRRVRSYHNFAAGGGGGGGNQAVTFTSAGYGKAQDNVTALATATGLTLFLRVKGDKLKAIPSGGIMFLLEVTDAASSVNRKINLELADPISDGTVRPRLNGNLLGTGVLATAIDATKWYTLIIQGDDAGTTWKYRAMLFESGTTAAIYDYKSNTSLPLSLDTMSGSGTVSINRSQYFVGSTAQTTGTWDLLAVLNGSPYETYDATTGVPADPTSASTGWLCGWALNDGSGSAAAAMDGDTNVLDLVNHTWVAGQ